MLLVTSSRSFCRSLVASGAALLGLSLTVMAQDVPQASSGRALPKTVTLKTDMVFHVPFSVSEDTVSVMAGTEVRLIDVRGAHLKLGHGLGEHVVDPASTDFAERLQKMPQAPAAPALSLAARSVQLPTDSSQPTPPLGNRDERARRGLGPIIINLIAALLVIGGLGALMQLVRRVTRSAAQKRRIELAVSGQASQDEIGSALNDLDWFQFEKLICALFRAQGHAVEMRGGANADGGIDLVLGAGSERTAVQCKHWGSWKCAPKVVRELLGAMTHEGFAQGMLVCRRATLAAHSLASQERITIIERDGVIQRVSQAMATENTQVRSLLFTPEKLCPKCGAPMVRRTAAKGSKVGSEFWGCSKYPECRQTMRV
jgi:hypothetical protein